MVVERLRGGLADGGHEDDASRGGAQPVARPEERGAPGALLRHDAVVAKDEMGDVHGLRPRLAVVVAPRDIGADGVRGGGVPQAGAAHEAGDEAVVVVAPCQGAVAEAVVHARAQGDGEGVAPSVSAVEAAVAHDVDVLGEVTLVVLAFVGDGHDAAVFGGDDRRDAVVGGVVVARLIY